MSRKYPAFLNLENKNILLIGGGKVAFEKLPHLIDSGAKITLITLEACREVAQVLEKHPEIKVEYRSVEFSDLQGKTLVFSATNDSDLNARLADYAHSWKIWINCADDPSNCDFYSAAVLDRGLVRVAIPRKEILPEFPEPSKSFWKSSFRMNTRKSLKNSCN
ncbi:Siroheme synthase domain protein [Leptospira borgpetersenii str. 4E]|nr:Siroheme synthase domain protein [Leptospira borgpetersenii str. 4E]